MKFDSWKEQISGASKQLRKAVDGYPPAWDDEETPFKPPFKPAFAAVSRLLEGDSPHNDVSSRKIKDAVASLTADDDPDGRLSSLLLAAANLVDAAEAAWNHIRWVEAQMTSNCPPHWDREFEQRLEMFDGLMREFWDADQPAAKVATSMNSRTVPSDD